MPAAETATLRVDLPCTKPPNFALRPLVASVALTALTVGLTLEGTLIFTEMDLRPISVLPEYVTQVRVPVPLVADGTCGARVAVGGVQDTEVAVVLVTTVPDALPKDQRIVWVKLLDALVMAMVPADPMVRVPQEMEDARGMVSSATVADTLVEV